MCAEKRQAEAQRIRDKYPDRIPVSLVPRIHGLLHAVFVLTWVASQVIVEKAERSEIPDIDKKK